MDPIAQLKEKTKEMFADFAQRETMTATSAPRLVRFAEVRPGDRVLDVACGTGVVALAAARLGAEVTGIDLTPELIAHAKENAAIMGLEARFLEGDAEALPFEDGSFDVVLSQFGHMFAPRPDVVTQEMLRVLRPGGTIAFSTWPPEGLRGQVQEIAGRYGSARPAGVPSPMSWGEPAVVRERLGDAVRELAFDRDLLTMQALSPQHARRSSEEGPGPLGKTVQLLEKEAPERLASLRAELEALYATYFHDNEIRQDYLLSRARKA